MKDPLFERAIITEHELKKMLATIQRVLVAASTNVNLIDAKEEIQTVLKTVHASIFDKTSTHDEKATKSPKM